ncbi:MAG: Do family serine endopeptidase [Treponema sp.]|nr:Do family serine endopeptidase [Treponema sp.]
MNLKEKLSSKSFFVFNLLLVGIIFGFSMAFLSFSCSTPGGGSVARAQESLNPVIIPADALAVADGLQRAFNGVVEKTLPSVVEVSTVSVQRRQSQNNTPWDFFFGPRQGEEQERDYRSQGIGSGVIIRQEGNTYYVLTNNHVIERTTEILIGTRDGHEYPAEIVGTDARRDLAILSFDSQELFPLAELGDSDRVKVGDWAIAMGNPLGSQFNFSVTMGIVSAVGRTGGPGGNINDFFQTDASINQGNSGGPLVNIQGEVIGINTWIASPTGGGNVGLGFAIPINNVKRVLDDIISTGNVRDGWLGVQLMDLDRDLMAALGLTGLRGASASQVFLGGPAYRGGIRPGDYIVAVDGIEIRNTNHLIQTVGNIRPGDSAVFQVIREGETLDFTVRIDIRTDDVAADSARLWPGLIVFPLTEQIRNSLELDRNAQGLYVSQVLAGSPAAIIGLQRGDRITSLNGILVNDLPGFYRALREETSRELWFGFIRGESTLESPRFRR